MSDVVLSAEKHFEALREVVWARFRARHRECTRERFDDAYAEWWTRELERSRAGRPSRADAPAAFVTEAVRRVLVDEARARARGVARDEKGSVELVDLASQVHAADGCDTAGQARYEALAHRVLTLVRGRLSERELRVFVWSFLYLRSTDATAAALGLSAPRVKKDRKRIATKVGGEVWAILGGELELCAAYEDKKLLAVFELLTEHAEDCPTCRAALGGVRRGALAIAGPAELLVLGGASEGATHVLSDAVDNVMVRIHGMLHRTAEALTSVPPSGRTAAAVAVAASAVAGGAVTVTAPQRAQHRPAPHVREAQHSRPTPRPAVTRAAATPRPAASATAARATPTLRTSKRRRPASSRHAMATPTPPPDPVTFEAQAPPPSASRPRASGAPPAPQTSPKEFGFEHG